ncbi:MAG: tRNA 2-thiocytidine(32) synthetase TtcA [Clostridiales bacterium]|nr:tRNA 2-thiocytidine(32) synthetase TtcA [Clostridiales bacterium]
MIADGDCIAVGVSGGKDSLTLLLALANLRRFYPNRFDLKAVTLDIGFPDMDFSPIARFCDQLDVEFILEKTDIREIVFDIRKEANPCSLCANLRRGALHNAALAHGCRTVALGHHQDDVIETYMLSLLYEGRINCFLPVTHLDRKDISVIRPLIYTPESYIRSIAKKVELPIVKSTCPADGNSKRQEIKDLLWSIERENRGTRQRIFGAIQRYPLRGWERTPSADSLPRP